METKKTDISKQVKETLSRELGLTLKDLADRLKTNRRFMAGFLSALEDNGEIRRRQVGAVGTYFVQDRKVKH